MKKVMILALLLIGLQINAQDSNRAHHKKGGHDRMGMLKEMPAEDIATLQTKKMTLHLDLSDSQQEKVKALVLNETRIKKEKMAEIASKKEAGILQKPSTEARIKMMNERLDRQIAMKRKMKDILNENQYKKWEKSLSHRHEKKGRKDYGSKARRK